MIRLILLLLYAPNLVKAIERNCSSNICLNGGICLVNDEQKNFHCACPSGFAGTLCQEICSLNCNQGKCVRDSTGKEHCECENGYHGKHCDIVGESSKYCENESDCKSGFKCMDNGTGEMICTKDPCSQIPCALNAKCIVEQDDFRCECGAGYAGRLCDADINECELAPCKNGGTCINTDGSYECKCPSGLLGPFCEDAASQCAPNPCQNHGQCIELLDGFKCLCAAGFTGTTCQQGAADFDPCSQSPCKNEGKCIVHDEKAFCICLPQWSGATCTEIANCLVDDHPCQNNGKCVRGLAVNTCQCEAGHSGKWCETSALRKWPDPCDGVECRNGGKCIEGTGECECSGGYTGENCEISEVKGSTIFPPSRTTSSFTLVQCSDCVHSHSCLELETGALCVCMKGYTGPTCFLTNQACNEIECDSSQQCQITHSLNWTVEAACGCPIGKGGPKCQQDVSATFTQDSLYVYQSPLVMIGSSSGPLPYNLALIIRTTVPDSHIVSGENIFGQRLFSLFIRNGRLVANVSGTGYFNLLPIGINDGSWIRLELRKTRNDFLIRVIEENGFEVLYREVPRTSQFDVFTTRIGRISEKEYFTGCVTDVWIDGGPVNIGTSNRAVAVKQGCTREPQCTENACAHGGMCIDMWSSYQCRCKSPYLPPSCIHQLDGYTFGAEGTQSRAVLTVDAENAKNLQAKTELQFLVRSNQLSGAVLFVGDNNQDDVGTFISAGLEDGHLIVRARAGGKNVMELQAEKFIADNQPHVIRIERDNRHVSLYIDGELQSESEIPVRFDHPLFVEKVIIGSIKDTNQDAFSSPESFKGFLQDIQLNSHSLVLKGTPEFEVKTIGSVQSTDNVLPGLVSDDVCRVKTPCAHGICTNTFNDYKCTCESGWMAKNCDGKDFCAENPCQMKAQCINTHGGYVCTSSVTLINSSFIQYDLQVPKGTPQAMFSSLNFDIKAASADGTILNLSSPAYAISLSNGKLQLTGNGKTHSVKQMINDARWHHVNIQGNVIQIDEKKYGLPDFARFTGGTKVGTLRLGQQEDQAGFRGSLSNVTIGDSLPLSFYRPENSGKPAQNDMYWMIKSWNKVERSLMESHSCDVNPCKNGGQCKDLLDRFVCDCAPGFSGVRCEINENDCEGRVCGNGYCLDEINNHRCICDGDWSGDGCDVPKDFCRKNPCKNDGVCQNLNGSYICDCQGDWMGRQCDVIKITQCKEKPCKNSRKCIQKGNKFTCSCLPGYKGTLCEEYISPCFSRPCKHGICKESGDSYVCECALGYSGKNCERLVPSCTMNNPCSRGRCENVWNGTLCHCDKGWQGCDCSVDINECLSIPCENDGECLNSDGGYTCHCRKYYLGDRCEVAGSCLTDPCFHGECLQIRHDEHQCKCIKGYEGINCETRIDYCKKSACKNGATCESLLGEYKCHCIAGFSGIDCETDIDECAAKPCQNHGICKDRVADYECLCDSTGFSGKNCTIDVDECLVKSNCIRGQCTNLPGAYRCQCEAGYVGTKCSMRDPCLPDENNKTMHACVHGVCSNPGVKLELGREVATHECTCSRGYSGPMCSIEMSERKLAVSYILGPLVAVLLVLCLLGCALFVFVLKGKRATHGHYSPSNQEVTGARLQMNSMIKLPPEERLI
ncbi:unnamed protein product, partial [Mesorhabditis belari]|uniref:Uncharacterized protein n=1 Tax=Mesorhabditis belari TaxID=2138241 RepID=A0AAF3FK81_9BILA